MAAPGSPEQYRPDESKVMRYKYDKLTGHRCIYTSLWAIGWLPGGKTHWINEWPYFHAGLGCLQFCIIAE